MAKDPIADQVIPDRATAEKIAKIMGCQGAHEVPGGWAPCESAEGLRTLIRRGARAYREMKKKGTPNRVIVDPRVEETLRQRKRRKKRKRQWENLGERGVRGIDTLPGGGLVSQ